MGFTYGSKSIQWQTNSSGAFIIFIKENDVLGDNQPIYRIDRRIEGSNRFFGDEAHIVNGENREDITLGHLMEDFANKDPDKFYYKGLANETRYYKYNEKRVRRMCKIIEKLINNGKNDEHRRMALNMLADGKLSLQDIAKYSGLTVTEAKALAKKSRRKYA